MSAIETYKPSGKFHPLVFLTVPGIGIVGGLALAWLYQGLVDWIPNIWANAACSLFFGACVGAIVGFGSKLGKCRNLGLAVGLGAATGLMALAASYYFAYQRVKSNIISDPELGAEIAQQFGFGDYIDARVEFGWTVTASRNADADSGTSFSGGMVYLIWLLEGVMVIGLAGAAPLVFAGAPFCEECDCWATKEKLGEIHHVDENAIKAAVAGAQWKGIIRPGGHPQSNTRARYTLYTCPSDSEPMYLSVELVKTVKKGRKQEDEQDEVLQYAKVGPKHIEHLRQSLTQGAVMPEGVRPPGPSGAPRPARPQGAAAPKRPGPPRPPGAGPKPPAGPRKPGGTKLPQRRRPPQ